jgi:hypothetical protein
MLKLARVADSSVELLPFVVLVPLAAVGFEQVAPVLREDSRAFVFVNGNEFDQPLVAEVFQGVIPRFPIQVADLLEVALGNPESDGRPDRDPREVEAWAREHDLAYLDEQVPFPDFRIEYELNGRDHCENVEVMSEHYRRAYAAAKGQTGYTCYRSGGGRGSGGSSSGGSPFDPRAAEDFL